MPKPDPTTVGAPCWIDLFSSDTDRARAFYGSLFGWTSESAGPEYGGYINFFRDGEMIAGCMHNDGSSPAPDMWSVYLRVDDAAATVDAATAHGGAVYVPAMPVMDLGTMGVVADPGGATIGLWQPGSHVGFAAVGEAGAPSWFELHTLDYAGSVAFYRDVFHWDAHTMSDAPEFRYTTLGAGASQEAGIMDATVFDSPVPPQWWIYFGTDDTDASIAQVIELGGSLVLPAEDSPYGRIAQVADPTGTMFKLVQPNPAS